MFRVGQEQHQIGTRTSEAKNGVGLSIMFDSLSGLRQLRRKDRLSAGFSRPNRSKRPRVLEWTTLLVSFLVLSAPAAAQANIARTCNPGNNSAGQQLAQGAPTDFAQFTGVPDDARFQFIARQNGGPQSVQRSGARFTRTGGTLFSGVTFSLGLFGRNGSGSTVRVAPRGSRVGQTANFRIDITGSGAPRRTAWTIVCLDDGPTVTTPADQTVDPFTPVSVSVTAQEPNDPDPVATYAWTVPAGITLIGADTPSPSFIAPFVAPGTGPRAILMELTVTDDDGDQVTTSTNVTINEADFDLSDAPSTYQDTGHVFNSAIRLGASIDIDTVLQASPTADGDGADDDGIAISELAQRQSATVTAQVAGPGGFLQGWIDFNGSGTFEADEQIAIDLQDGGAGDTNADAGTLTFDFPVPQDAIIGQSVARFRWSTQNGIDAVTFAPDGEVEDYAVTLLPDPLTLLAPFTCSGDFYQVHGRGNSNLSVVDLLAGTFSAIGNTGASIRGTGLNPDDLLAYGMQDQNPALGNVLFAVGSDGSSVNLDQIPGLPNLNFASGDFGPGGLLYVRSNGNNRPLIAIDVETRTIVRQYSPVGITNPNTADFAFNPVDQSFYSVESSSGNARLLRFTLGADLSNPTFTVEAVGATGIQTSGNGGNNVFGAMYADNSGNVFGIRNSTGRLYQFSTTDGTPVLVGQGAASSQNDGFSCAREASAIPQEFGDAPVTGTVDGIAANYGEAAQNFSPDNALIIGATSTDDAANQPSNSADADADDGLATVPEAITTDTSYAVTVPVLNETGGDVFLCGFIDAGRTNGLNGMFDAADERVCATVPDSNSSQDVNLDFTGLDFSAAPGTSTFLRLRLSSVQSEAESATGAGASIGEVEDYAVTIEAQALPVVPSCAVAQRVTENTAPNRNIIAGTCSADVSVTSDGVTANPGYCPLVPLPPDYEIAYDYVLPTGDRMYALTLYANAGGNINDGELRTFDLEVDYTDAVGASSTLVMNNVNIGDTTALDSPRSVPFIANGQAVSLPNVTQIRMSNLGGSSGEVPFREVQGACGRDFSDAPASFADASHQFDPAVVLGASATVDTGAVNDDGDTDDGITIPALAQGQTATITAEVIGAGGFLQAWIDFDGSGTFEAAEQVATDLQDDGSGADAAVADGTLTFDVDVPANAVTAQTFARFRWSTMAGLDASAAAPDGEVEDYAVTVLPGAIPLSGAVFFDNGVGTVAMAHNGLIEGEEPGAGDVTVVAVDVLTGSLVGSVATAGDGTFILDLPPAQDGRDTRLQIVTPADALLLSNSPASASVGVEPADRSFTLTPAVGAPQTGLNFGLAQPPRLVLDQEQSIQSGGVALFSHRFITGAPVEASFAIINEESATLERFTMTLFADSDCSGSIDAGETLLTTPQIVAANQEVCLLVRVANAAGSVQGEDVQFELVANGTYGNAPETFALENFDRLTVGTQAALQLTKMVCNTRSGSCDVLTGAGFDRSNTGAPGDTLIYRLVFQNGGAGIIDDVRVNDDTPAFSSLTATPPGVVTSPQDLTCALTAPTSPAAGFEGGLEWICPGEMQAGSVGVVTFEVRIAD